MSALSFPACHMAGAAVWGFSPFLLVRAGLPSMMHHIPLCFAKVRRDENCLGSPQDGEALGVLANWAPEVLAPRIINKNELIDLDTQLGTFSSVRLEESCL